MQNLITIENTQAVVELSTISKFAEIDERSLQNLLRDYEKDLDSLKESGISNPTLIRGKSGKQIDWFKVRLSEKQVYFVLTLLKNTENVKKFKLELIKQFFTMRDEIQKIREDALRLEFKEEKAKAIRDAKKPKVYANGFMSLKGCLVELREQGIETIKENEAWDMLVHYGYVKTMPKITIKRDIDTDNEIAKYVMASRTSYGLPTFDLKFINDLVYQYIQDGKPKPEEADELRERFSKAAIKYVDENLLI